MRKVGYLLVMGSGESWIGQVLFRYNAFSSL